MHQRTLAANPLPPGSIKRPQCLLGSFFLFLVLTSCSAPPPIPDAKKAVGADKKALVASTQALMAKNDYRDAQMELERSGYKIDDDPELRALSAEIDKHEYKAIPPRQTSTFDETTAAFWTHDVEEVAASVPESNEEGMRRIGVFEEVAHALSDAQSPPLSVPGRRAWNRVHQLLAARQALVFPELRTGYGRQTGAEVWRLNGSVSVSGAGGRTLTITAPEFASNANVQDVETAGYMNFQKLRFTHVGYRWSEFASRLIYTLKTPRDADVGYWDGLQYRTVK